MNDNSILDKATIEMLKDVMGGEFQLLLDTFLNDAPERINSLRSFLVTNDVAAMERPAHTLKGSSGNIGAIALSLACSVLVNQIRTRTVTDAAAQIAAIEQEFERVKPLLQQFRV